MAELPGLTVADVAIKLGRSESTVWRLIREGRIQVTRYGDKPRGGPVRITRRALERARLAPIGRPRRG